ncbi:MAG: hypothetical protein JXR26_09735 [Balneolaceae bacterium]|nr:hypothetical protein [Balneolaceae bacterium]
MKKLIITLFVGLFITTAVFAQSGDEKGQPPFGMEPKAAYSLFYSAYDNENYENALRNGRWILISMPREIEGYSAFDLPTQLNRFATIYEEIAKQKSDPSLKKAYLDSADAVYQKAFDNFSQDEINYYEWYLYRGRLYQENPDFFENAKEKAAEQYMKAYELNPKEMAKTADGYYVRVLIQNLVSKDSEEAKQQALSIMKNVESYASDDLKGFFNKMRGRLFDTPDEQITFLEGKIESNPEDTTALRQLRNLYENEEMLSKAQEINKKLYEMDPSYQTVTSLANFAVKNGNYDEAIKYLNEAKTKTNEDEKLKSIYQSLAQAYLNKGNMQQARDNARKAKNIDPDWAAPYMTIASAYARTVSNCISNREMTRDDRAVYWLVMDYLQKAKQVDSSLSSTVNNQLAQYRQAAPSDEDIFFVENWSKGGSVRIDGSLGSCYSWIGESTTVR